MSVTSGGTALNGFSASGSRSASAGSAGIEITLRAPNVPSWWRSQRNTDADRSAVETTEPTKPYALSGLCAGRSSSAILVLRAEVDLLKMAAALHVPDVQPVAIAVAEQQLGVDAGLDHV